MSRNFGCTFQVVLLMVGTSCYFPFSLLQMEVSHLDYTVEGSPLLQIWEKTTEAWISNTVEPLCQCKMLVFRLYLKEKQASPLFLSLTLFFISLLQQPKLYYNYYVVYTVKYKYMVLYLRAELHYKASGKIFSVVTYITPRQK